MLAHFFLEGCMVCPKHISDLLFFPNLEVWLKLPTGLCILQYQCLAEHFSPLLFLFSEWLLRVVQMDKKAQHPRDHALW